MAVAAPAPAAAPSPHRVNNLLENYKYMLFEFKTKPCPDIVHCPDYHQCRHYHSFKDQRRDPRAIRNGVPDNFPPWDYGPDDCSLFERCYHPVNYKNQRCRDYWGGYECPRGQDCSFVHDESEFLWKVYPEICYPIMSFEEFEYLVMNFKVHRCTKNEYHNRHECVFFHTDYDPTSDDNSFCDRRFPWRVDSQGEYIIDYAISAIEKSMLPSIYKTSRCSPRNPNLPCRFKRCCFSHSDLETSTIQEYRDILKERLTVFLLTSRISIEPVEPDEEETTPNLSLPSSTNTLEPINEVALGDEMTEEMLRSQPERYIPLSLGDSRNYEMYVDVEAVIGFGMGASKVFGGFGHQLYPRRQNKEYFPVAIKIIPLGGNYLTSSHIDRLTTSELGFLLNLRASNIIALYDHYRSIELPDNFIRLQNADWQRLTTNTFSVFCMERFGNSLSDVIQSTQSTSVHSQFNDLYSLINGKLYPRSTISHMIKDLLKGLSHIHEKFHVHRDLRPSNLLVCLDNSSPDGVRFKDL